MTDVKTGSTTSLEATVGEASRRPPKTGKTIAQEIDTMGPQITAALPPNTLTPERFLRTVLTEVRGNDKLLLCSRESFLGAMLVSAQLGLEVGSQLGQAYLIPYGGECTFQVGYKGYVNLGYRNGIILEAREVKDGDEFDFDQGTDPYLHHKWKLGQTRGPVIGYYGTASFQDGRRKFHVMDLPEIEARRARAQARNNGPWVTDYDAMARKTVIRAMVPQLPLSPESGLGLALANDEGVVRHGRDGNLDVSFPESSPEALAQAGPPQEREVITVNGSESTQSAPSASLPATTAVDELLAECTPDAALEAEKFLADELGEDWDGNDPEVVTKLRDYLDSTGEEATVPPAPADQPVEARETPVGGEPPWEPQSGSQSAPAVSDEVLARLQRQIGAWDTALCDRVLRDFGLPRAGAVAVKRLRLLQNLAPRFAAGEEAVVALF